MPEMQKLICRLIALGAAGCVAMAVVPNGGQGPQRIDSPEALLRSLQREYIASKRADDPAILRRIGREANARGMNLSLSDEARAGFLALAAHVNFTLASVPKEYQRTIDLLKEILEMDVSDFRRMETMRLMLQIHSFFTGDANAAAEVFQEMDSILRSTADPRLHHLKAQYVFDTYSKGATALSQLGLFDASIAARRTILESQDVTLDGVELAQTCLELARDLRRSGRDAEALAYYDRLMGEFEEFCVGSGSGPYFEMERLDVMGLKKEAALLELTRIWNDPKYARSSAILVVGARLRQWCRDTGNSLEEAVSREMISRIENGLVAKDSLDYAHLDVPMLLEQSYFALAEFYQARQEWDLAYKVLREFSRKYPESALMPTVRHELRRIQRLRTGDAARLYLFVGVAILGVPIVLVWLREKVRREAGS
jgi:tetratricopeptide (TPR) repeat protein